MVDPGAAEDLLVGLHSEECLLVAVSVEECAAPQFGGVEIGDVLVDELGEEEG